MFLNHRSIQNVPRFRRGFDHFFRHGGDQGEHADFTPAVDIDETEEAVVLSADLPGVDEKDIEITVHQGVLVLTGKREDTREDETENTVYRERRHGSFFRRFRLGSKVNADAIHAVFKNGVLTVTLPKKEEAKPKQIPVATA